MIVCKRLTRAVGEQRIAKGAMIDKCELSLRVSSSFIDGKMDLAGDGEFPQQFQSHTDEDALKRNLLSEILAKRCENRAEC